jgi:predicted Zn finger-like uncharacterized protein
MFTRCPACKTVFYITAAELKAADGTVICGACDETFDALDSLSETRPPAEAPPEPADTAAAEPPAAAPEEEARDEDEFLEAVEALIGDDEFDDDIPDPDSVFRVDEPLVEVSEDGDEQEAFAPEAGEEVFAPESAQARTREGAVGPPMAEDEERTPTPAGQPGRAALPARVAEDAAAGVAEAGFPEEAAGQESEAAEFLELETDGRRRRWLRVLVPAFAIVVLGGSWIHAQRGQILRHPAGDALVGPFYRALGVDATPEWAPEEFRVLRSEAVADPGRPGNLRVSVEFRNAAGFPQPYPVIRVVLQDRFGQQVGSSDFSPEEYFDGHAAGSRLQAGERVQIAVAVPDPGARADGFRVSLCLELGSRGLVCAAEERR